jgi:hypothetical protein
MKLSIPGASRFPEKQRLWNGVHLVRTTEELLEGKVAAPV